MLCKLASYQLLDCMLEMLHDTRRLQGIFMLFTVLHCVRIVALIRQLDTSHRLLA